MKSEIAFKLLLLILILIKFQYFCVKGQFRLGLRLVSQNPADIKFYIYNNKSNPEQHTEIIYNNKSSLKSSGYEPSKPCILFIHGMLSNYKTSNDVLLVKNAFLETNKQSNLIMVDYGLLTSSNLPFLFSGLSILHGIGGHLNTIIVANRIADFITFLNRTKSIPAGGSASKVRLVGFSLGCHISGVVGRLIAERSNGTQRLGRITALDPSPQFPLPNWRLAESAASFIDVSYTSLSMLAGLGSRKGHVEFYVNGGGPHQPNCPNLFPVAETYCSHSTAAYYYAKSIKYKDIKACNCGFECTRGDWEARKDKNTCKDAIVYGDAVNTKARGNYYVDLA